MYIYCIQVCQRGGKLIESNIDKILFVISSEMPDYAL